MRRRIWIPEAPMLNFRRYREVGALQSKVSFEGWFTLELIHKRSGLIAQRCHFRNLIVDAGLDALNQDSPRDLMTYCAVGTGNVAPVNGNIGLGTEIVRTNSTGGFPMTTGWAAANEYFWFRVTRVFTTAQANDVLAEVGMFRLSSGAPMFCRQLIKDNLGSPTTIAKTSDYELRVIYECRVYPTLTDVVYSATVNGAAMDVTVRPAEIDNTNDWADTSIPGLPSNGGNVAFMRCFSGGAALGLVTGLPSGTRHMLAAAGDYTNLAYTNGNFYRDTEITWKASVANAADIKAFYPGFRCYSHQHLLAGTVSKDNTQKLVLVTRHSWDRHTP